MSKILQHNHDVLLQTKLHRPVFSGDYLCRPRLLEILDQVLNTPLTLVSAPAGYGKSRLLSHWVESQDVPCAWLSLDDSDSGVGVFIDYLLAAVETAFPDACPQTRLMAQSPESSSRLALVRSLTNELDAHEAPLVVVLDQKAKTKSQDIQKSQDIHI